MSDIVFARPRYDYGSYTDFYSLIRLSGYPLIYFDEIDPVSDNLYIMTIVNGENQGGWQSPKAKIILYDIEWRLEGEYPRIPGVSEVWAADAWYADKIGAHFVPMGSHPDLNPEPNAPRPDLYDYAMLMYFTHRRQWVRDRVLQAGCTVTPNAWGDERHKALLGSKAMLNVHQREGVRTIAPARWALAAAYRLPIIGEHIDSPLWHGTFYAYDDLINAAVMWRTRTAELRALGDCLYQQMCIDRPFAAGIEAAV